MEYIKMTILHPLNFRKTLLFSAVLSMAAITNSYGTRDLTAEEIEQQKKHDKMNSERIEKISALMAKTECPEFTIEQLREIGKGTYMRGHPITAADGTKWDLAQAYSSIDRKEIAQLNPASQIKKVSEKPQSMSSSDLPEFCEYKLTLPDGGERKLTLMYVE
jgi:hypothetical protein